MEQAISDPPLRKYTVSEYFEIDAAADHKSDYRNGEIISMAGGSESHSLITMNVGGEIRSRLKNSPCRVYDSNFRVRVKRGVRYSYPDVLVVCGEPQSDPDDPGKTTTTNPKLIVEVLSPSTELSDRSEKFYLYIHSESQEEYVLIAQDRAIVQTFFRHPDRSWAMAFYEGRDAVAQLRSLQIDLPLTEMYAKVDLPLIVE